MYNPEPRITFETANEILKKESKANFASTGNKIKINLNNRDVIRIVLTEGMFDKEARIECTIIKHGTEDIEELGISENLEDILRTIDAEFKNTDTLPNETPLWETFQSWDEKKRKEFRNNAAKKMANWTSGDKNDLAEKKLSQAAGLAALFEDKGGMELVNFKKFHSEGATIQFNFGDGTFLSFSSVWTHENEGGKYWELSTNDSHKMNNIQEDLSFEDVEEIISKTLRNSKSNTLGKDVESLPKTPRP